MHEGIREPQRPAGRDQPPDAGPSPGSRQDRADGEGRAPLPLLTGRREQVLSGLLRLAEAVVYGLTALVLVSASLFALGSAASALVAAVAAREGGVRPALTALDQVLVVLILTELFYTVRLSLRERGLAVEPFIAVALIATVRRILVVTAEERRLLEDPELFRRVLLELGLLAGLVPVLALALVLLRRLQPRPRPEGR